MGHVPGCSTVLRAFSPEAGSSLRELSTGDDIEGASLSARKSVGSYGTINPRSQCADRDQDKLKWYGPRRMTLRGCQPRIRHLSPRFALNAPQCGLKSLLRVDFQEKARLRVDLTAAQRRPERCSACELTYLVRLSIA
eukprot:447476-Rhodomonas_salina.1